jgi:malonyl-CoA O-methyltransferase
MRSRSFLAQVGAAAQTYDSHAFIQQAAARDLLAFCPRKPTSILEIGCGTGYYTTLLRQAFPAADVVAIDISDAMLRFARARPSLADVQFVQADAGEYCRGRYDLVTSNAVFHWIENLPGMLSNISRLLNRRGCLVFSYFGPETYGELRQALSYALGRSIELPASRFLGPGDLEKVLANSYSAIRIETRYDSEKYASLTELLRKIKATGTRGTGAGPPVTWTPGLLRRIEKLYRSRFGSVRATFGVSLCSAILPGEPLPPRQ